jgi:hypothetical protein
METLVDGLGRLGEVGHGRIGDHNMHRCEGFALIQTPDVQLVDGEDAGDLSFVSIMNHTSVDEVGDGWWDAYLFQIVFHVRRINSIRSTF